MHGVRGNDGKRALVCFRRSRAKPALENPGAGVRETRLRRRGPVNPMSGDALLAGRRALVTGASGAIGAAICREFERHGAECAGADVVPGAGVIACDVSDEASVRAAFDEVARGGRLSDVVHAAGIVSVGSVAEQSLEEFRRVIDINLTGTFLVAREAARRVEDHGAITLISSQAGLESGAFWSAYSASKAGVLRIAESLALELAPRGVRANAVCPGEVETTMIVDAMAGIAKLRSMTPEAVRKVYTDEIPLGRFATPEEVARVCVFLASPLAAYVTGSAQTVDGGLLSR